jgi:hypothetical protein
MEDQTEKSKEELRRQEQTRYDTDLSELNGKRHDTWNKITTVSNMIYTGLGVVFLGGLMGIAGTCLMDPYSNNPSVVEHRKVEQKLQDLKGYQSQIPSFYFAPELKQPLQNLQKSIDGLVGETQAKLKSLESEEDYIQDHEWLANHGDGFALAMLYSGTLAGATLFGQISANKINSYAYNRRKSRVPRPRSIPLNSQA